jgi:hypothetical protein
VIGTGKTCIDIGLESKWVALANKKQKGSDLATSANGVRRGCYWLLLLGAIDIKVPVESHTSPIGNELGWH